MVGMCDQLIPPPRTPQDYHKPGGCSIPAGNTGSPMRAEERPGKHVGPAGWRTVSSGHAQDVIHISRSLNLTPVAGAEPWKGLMR